MRVGPYFMEATDKERIKTIKQTNIILENSFFPETFRNNLIITKYIKLQIKEANMGSKVIVESIFK